MTVLGSILQPWLFPQADRALTVARSGGSRREHVAGPDIDRILLAIDRPAVGRGAHSQELSFAGHLARHLSSLSGRGVDLDILDSGNLPAAECATALATLNLAKFDAIVLMVGSSEALSLVPTRSWVAELSILLDDIEDTAPHSVHTFVIAIPSVRGLIDIPTLFAPLVEASIRRLNLATAGVCEARTRSSSLSFDIPTATRDKRHSRGDSEVWAALIAPVILHELVDVSGRVRSDRDE
jgi:hypothetical protein